MQYNKKICDILEEGKRCKANLVCIGPTGAPGPTGPTGPSGGSISVFGGLYNSTSQLVNFPSADTYVKLNLNTALPTNQVTPNADSTLTINETGTYEINYNILISTSAAVDVTAAVRNSGTIIPQTRGSQTLAVDNTTTLSYDGRLSCSTIANLTAGSVLELVISVLRTLPTGLDAAVNGNANCTLTIKKLNN